MDPAILKQTFKEAIIEALHENGSDLSKPEHHGELRDLLAGVFEDIGLGFAIREAEHETPVPFEEVRRVLQGGE